MENERKIQNEWQPDSNELQPANPDNEQQAAMVSETDGDYPTQKYYADDDRDDDDDDDESEDTDEDESNSDWGNVDPLSHPGPPSDMDPSAPGSAV